MKKGVFNIWFKELCSLVFTQSVQAFLLAIIMSIVLSVFSDGEQNDASMSAAGVIAIIALASISKIELLIKKIFGIESQFGDPSMANGMKSVAGGILAAKSVGKIANNVPKMVGGAKEIMGAKKDAARAQQRVSRKLNLMKESMAAESGDPGSGPTGGPTGTPAGGPVGGPVGGPTGGPAGAPTSAPTGGPTGGPTGAPASGPTSAPTGAPAGVSIGVSTGSSTGTPAASATQSNANNSAAAKKSDIKYREKMLDIQEKYEEEMAKAKKRRSEGRRKMVSGVAESIGAIGGAATGFAVGAGSGDISKGLAYGIGTGDTIGKNIVSAGYNAKDMVSDVKSVNKANRDAINEMRKVIDGESAVKETRGARTFGEFKELRRQKTELAKKVAKEMDSMMDAGKL